MVTLTIGVTELHTFGGESLKYHAIHNIACEDAWQKMWDHFLYFETEPTVRKFLESCYQHIDDGIDQSVLAQRNTYKMIYLSKQAREFFQSGVNSSLLVRPLLLYYGMVNLAKMLILAHDPLYPSHTKLLAHGVTTRKLKKGDYLFLEDEVKIQKDGLLPHLMSLLTGRNPRESYKIKELISLIPELMHTYQKLYQDEVLIPIYIPDEVDTKHLRTTLYLPLSILEHERVRLEDFVSKLNQFNQDPDYFTAGEIYERQKIFELYWHQHEGLHLFDSPNGFSNPIFIRDVMGRHYFWTRLEERLILPEITVHLLIMYLLGMLCRYDGDLWGEIHFSFYSQDLYLIHEFIHTSPRKYPNLILNLLFNEIYYFKH